ncbi:zinc finger protein GLI1-like [Diorhabda carinulata]|uniref:zinc finger protein GLI1-like n=1 Tax=Diorhabda carinulata TaxID=1163345 RepID=UPI0025A07668|nr:zinc finger protein GLI1-like [Diorhabda carinulata]
MTPASTPNSEIDINFDFDDFAIDFDQNVTKTTEIEESFDTETFTTESSFGEPVTRGEFSQFYVPPPFHGDKINETCIGFESIDFSGDIIDGAFVMDGLKTEENSVSDYECHGFLPPVDTIKNNVNFNNFLRKTTTNDLEYINQDSTGANCDFGHLLGSKCSIQFIDNSTIQEPTPYFDIHRDNQMVLTQSEALLNDDPLLSASNPTSSINKRKYAKEIDDNVYEEVSSTLNVQCKWENCYQFYESQSLLVKHIEKCHVELKRGEEFTCYWSNCPRKTKPFNARYKLLIHMRVHSGEKPNECPFKGCNKAFSRLENLKIHQRSHTGERPYVCQFSTCPKSFSNSSDRAKHQRTHFDTKPYACQVVGCPKKYTDPSSLRKHVKNHTCEEQMQIKKKTSSESSTMSFATQSLVKKFLDPNKQKAVKNPNFSYSSNFDHSYSTNYIVERKYDIVNIKQDLKNKISEKSKLRRTCC